MRFKARRGSILVVITYATLMAFVCLSMMALSLTLYTGAKASATTYSDLQNYRAATEISCYQYIRDLEAITVNRTLSFTHSAAEICYEGLNIIQETISREGEPYTWNVENIIDAITGANIDNPVILESLLGRLKSTNQTFQLSLESPMTLDWDSTEIMSKTYMSIPLLPIEIKVDFRIKSETLVEQFKVDGLFLDVELESQAGGTTKTRLFLTEREEGVTITRE